MMGYFNRNLG